MDILRINNGEGSASPEIVLDLLQSSAFSFRHTFSSEYYIHYRDDTEEQERSKKSIGFLYEKICYQVCLWQLYFNKNQIRNMNKSKLSRATCIIF